MSGNRINIRVDEATQRQVQALVRATGRTTSDVVREAIAVHHAQVCRNRAVPKRLLAMAGKGRSLDGRTDISIHYKQIFAESLADKYELPLKPRPLRKP